MHILFGAIPCVFGFPTKGHRPLILGLPLWADKKVYEFDHGRGALAAKKLTYMCYDYLDVGVAFA